MGVTINTAIVLASAEMHKDANLLQSIDLTEVWAKYLLHRIGYVKRKGTTKAKMSVEHFEEVRKEYLLDTYQVYYRILFHETYGCYSCW